MVCLNDRNAVKDLGQDPNAALGALLTDQWLYSPDECWRSMKGLRSFGRNSWQTGRREGVPTALST